MFWKFFFIFFIFPELRQVSKQQVFITVVITVKCLYWTQTSPPFPFCNFRIASINACAIIMYLLPIHRYVVVWKYCFILKFWRKKKRILLLMLNLCSSTTGTLIWSLCQPITMGVYNLFFMRFFWTTHVLNSDDEQKPTSQRVDWIFN